MENLQCPHHDGDAQLAAGGDDGLLDVAREQAPRHLRARDGPRPLVS